MAVFLWNLWFYSFCGWYLERLFAAVTRSPRQRRHAQAVHRAQGQDQQASAAVLALPPLFLSGWRLYVFGGLTATTAEYLYHWWGEVFLCVRFWDYSTVPGNLHGRISLPFSLAWGFLLFPAVKLAPIVADIASRTPPLLTWLCLMIFTIDAVCSLRFLAVTHDLNALRYAF